MHDVLDLMIFKRMMNHLLAPVVAIVCCSRMAGVDSEELALNVRRQVRHPVYSIYFGVSMRLEWLAFHDPFEKGFDLNVEAGVGLLVGDDTVDGGVCKACSLGQTLETVFGCIFRVTDKAREGVGGTNGIFAGDDGSWIGSCAFVDAFGDDRGDEFENIRANGAGNLERWMVS